MFRALGGFDLGPVLRMDVQVMLYSHIQGLAAQLEGEAAAQSATGLTDDEWLERQGTALAELAGSGDYPGFTALVTGFGEQGYDLDLDRIFELGLATLLDGLAVRLAAS